MLEAFLQALPILAKRYH